MEYYTLGITHGIVITIYAVSAGLCLYSALNEKYQNRKPWELLTMGLFGPVACLILSPLLLIAAWNWFFHGHFDLGDYS